MKYILAVVLVALPGISFAETAPDPVLLQRAIVVLQQQRNQAMDSAADMQVKAQGLAEELAKAKEKIKELEAKAEKKQDDAK